MVRVVYVGGSDEVEIVAQGAGFRAVAVRGVPLEVPETVAFGMPAKDPESLYGGLLDQTDAWRRADDPVVDASPPVTDGAESKTVSGPRGRRNEGTSA